MFVHCPSPGSEGLKARELQKARGSRLAHFAIVLLVLIGAWAGTGLAVRRTTVPGVPPAIVSPVASAQAAGEAAPKGGSGAAMSGTHFRKDALAIVVCFLAASLWWLVRSPSGRQRLRKQSADNSRPFVLLPSPWNADEQERKQISRDLHDCVGQVLTAANLELSSLRAADLSWEQRRRLESVAQLNAEALRLVRDLAMGLRPAMLDDMGLTASLQWQVRQFSRRSGIPASMEVSGPLDALPERHRTCIYRCLQEALTNCARHSRANRVQVGIHARENAVAVAIEDDGVGLGPAARTAPGLGILGMHERVEALGGSLVVERRREQGTRVRLEIPVILEVHA
jgi:signal transduction histidine kinase